MAKVMISHRTSDTPQAENLATDLKNAGHDVWLDAWEIGLGDSITGKMNEGLKDAQFVVLCLSVQGVDAPWMSREWLSALARQLEGKKVKLLPVKLTGGELPAILADIQYADAVKDYSKALSLLLKALQKGP